MNLRASSPPGDPAGEIPRLIETLLATERRLVELTAGEVDAVAGRDGRSFLLQHAQEQLRHSEAAKQDAILNALPAHVALLDAQGLIISVNEAWRRFGRSGGMASQRQAEGMNYLAICDGTEGPGSADALAAARGIRAVLAGTTPEFSIEYPCHSPAAQAWFLMMVTPLMNDHLHGVVVMHVDITARKLAAATLEELSRKTERREQMLTTMLSATTDFAYICDREGRFLFANQPLLRMWGRTMEEVVGRDFAELGIPPALAGRLRQEVEQVFVTRQNITGETPYTSPTGRPGYYEYIFSPACAADGTVDFVVGSSRDITDRKRAEAVLRASEERFRALFDQAAGGVAQLDVVTGRYLQVNRRFCEIVGRGADEMEQLTFAAITHPEDMGHSQEMARRLQAGIVREYTQEKRYVQEGRADVWASVTVSAMWAVGEKPDSFIVVAQDITRRKQLEEQLRQAHKLEAIGTLAGGIAHDFNNILAAIGGYTELARMKLPDNPGVREHLDAVIQAVKRAADLVRQILTFSRDQPLERRLIRLQPVVAECVKLLRATLPAAIELDLVLAEDAPTVFADETQVHQILMNLGTNARHALGTRPGRIQMKVERCTVDEAQAAAQAQLRPGCYARVSVGDNGSGMDAETLRRIFEPFFTTKAPGAGTGLGLAVVHGIMDSHDGVITVDSQPGTGTVFHLYFPAQAAEAALAARAQPDGPSGRGERVLFVDDEEVLVRLAEKSLHALGYEVEVARQPAAALALVRADPTRFALVMTDQAMPGMTGLQLAAELRQIRPNLPIILITGYSLTLTAERVKAAGIQQLLLKPTTINSLGTAAHAALSGQPLTTHGSHPPY